MLIVFCIERPVFNNKEKTFLQYKHPNQEDQAPHLQILHNNLQDCLQDNQHFQHWCHLLYFSHIQDKWVINLSKEELTPEEMSLLQKGLNLQLPQQPSPLKEYISTTTVAAFKAGKLNGVDCSGLYHDVNGILNTYTNKTILTNITKAEHLALENLREDMDHIIVTAAKGCDLGCNG